MGNQSYHYNKNQSSKNNSIIKDQKNKPIPIQINKKEIEKEKVKEREKEKKIKEMEKEEEEDNTNDNMNEEKEINLEIHFCKDIISDLYNEIWLDNTFCVFKAINNVLYILYTNNSNSIVSYNLIDEKKINEIKNAHEKYITNFRHYFDENNNRDLFLSISYKNNNIKLWDFFNFECLLDLKNIYKDGFLYSACLFNFKNKIYISATNNAHTMTVDSIKIFDMNGEVYKKIYKSNDPAVFIDTYYDKKCSKLYLLTGNKGYCKSYDYDRNCLYRTYKEKGSNTNENSSSAFIYNEKGISKLIESNCIGNVKIWDFHSARFLKKIIINNDWLYGIGLWGKNYIFVGCINGEIDIVDINEGIIVNSLIDHKEKVLTIKKIYHPKYGESLVSQSLECIKLWTNGQLHKQ